MKQVSGIYTFREISSEAELLQAFRLRYQVYQQSATLCALLKDNAAQLDIDGFDIYARHCGIFKRAGGGDVLVGYLRVVEQQKKAWVEDIIEGLEQTNQLLFRVRFFCNHGPD